MEKVHSKDASFFPSTYDSVFHGELGSNASLANMPYRILGKTELDLSILSYGGSSLAKFYGDEINQESIQTIRSALKSGVNYIDTSPWYGDSELLIGQALNGIPRNAFYIGTKVGRNFTPGWENRFNFSRSAVLKNVENSLRLLGLDSIDIIQVHDVEFCLDQKVILEETLPALESVVRAGKAKYIGITGYSLQVMKEIVEASPVKIDTILSYCRLNFHDTSLLDYAPYFESKNIGIINAAPLAMGQYTTRGFPDWHPASDEVKNVTNMAKSFLSDRKMTIEETALGFGLRPEPLSIATTLVSMPNSDILKTNLEVATRPTTDQERNVYKQIQNIFTENVMGNRHWEGKEVAEYKAAICSSTPVNN